MSGRHGQPRRGDLQAVLVDVALARVHADRQLADTTADGYATAISALLAAAAGDPAARRRHLVDLAARAVAWVQAIDTSRDRP